MNASTPQFESTPARAAARPLRRRSGLATLAATLAGVVALAQPLAHDWIEQGFDALDAVQPAAALQQFNAALEQNPGSAEITAYVGLAQFALHRYEDALEAFAGATVLDDSVIDSTMLFYQASAYRALGLVNLERDTWQRLIDWDESSRFAEKARELLQAKASVTATTDALVNEGLRHCSERPNLSVAYFREALAAAAADAPAELPVFCAVALNRAGRPAEVLALAPSGELAPAWRQVWSLNRAMALMATGDWVQAQAALENIATDSSLYAQAAACIDVCKVHLGDVRVARNMLSPRGLMPPDIQAQ